jgi:hypothetical protein
LKSCFCLSKNQKQNNGENHKKDKAHTMDAFTVLGFWEDFGSIGEKSRDEINRCYLSNND